LRTPMRSCELPLATVAGFCIGLSSRTDARWRALVAVRGLTRRA
jgi:hypothetical protein